MVAHAEERDFYRHLVEDRIFCFDFQSLGVVESEERKAALELVCNGHIETCVSLDACQRISSFGIAPSKVYLRRERAAPIKGGGFLIRRYRMTNYLFLTASMPLTLFLQSFLLMQAFDKCA